MRISVIIPVPIAAFAKTRRSRGGLLKLGVKRSAKAADFLQTGGLVENAETRLQCGDRAGGTCGLFATLGFVEIEGNPVPLPVVYDEPMPGG